MYWGFSITGYTIYTYFEQKENFGVREPLPNSFGKRFFQYISKPVRDIENMFKKKKIVRRTPKVTMTSLWLRQDDVILVQILTSLKTYFWRVAAIRNAFLAFLDFFLGWSQKGHVDVTNRPVEVMTRFVISIYISKTVRDIVKGNLAKMQVLKFPIFYLLLGAVRYVEELKRYRGSKKVKNTSNFRDK